MSHNKADLTRAYNALNEIVDGRDLTQKADAARVMATLTIIISSLIMSMYKGDKKVSIYYLEFGLLKNVKAQIKAMGKRE